MKIHVSLSKPGHYAKNAAKAITKPINTAIALVVISSALSFNEAQAQNTNYKSTNGETIENGYGNLLIKDVNGGVVGATVVLTPISVPGDSIPEPYTYITSGSGAINYDVLVFCDRDVAVQNNYNIEVIQARPNPSTDFTFNFITNERPNNPLEIRSINGALVGKYDLENHIGNVAIYHADLSNQANGIYFATTTIDGKPQLSKLVKINGAIVGNLGSPAKETQAEKIYKSSQANEAIYEVSITAQGYHDLVEQRTIIEGDNGWDFYTLISNEAPPIDNQDLAGIVTDLNNNYAAIAGATVEAYIPSLNQTISTTTTSDGSFVLENVPLGTDIEFSAGGIDNKYSITNFPFTTIAEVTNPADSVWSYFDVVLPDVLPGTTTLAHAIDQNIQGTSQDTIWYYLGNSFNETEKNFIRNSFATLQAYENNVYIYAEKFEQSNIGINIEKGTYNTQAYANEIITPLGNTLYPVIYANSTMSTGDLVNQIHEAKNALGYDIVSWFSVQRSDSPDYTQEDTDISVDLSRPYWNAVYQDGKTYIPMQYLAEDMSSKSSSQPIKDVKARIYELKKMAEEKIIEENIPDYFNSSSSYGNVEFNSLSK